MLPTETDPVIPNHSPTLQELSSCSLKQLSKASFIYRFKKKQTKHKSLKKVSPHFLHNSCFPAPESLGPVLSTWKEENVKIPAALPDTIVQRINYRTETETCLTGVRLCYFNGHEISIVALLSVAEQEATSLSWGMNFIWWHQFPRSACKRGKISLNDIVV